MTWVPDGPSPAELVTDDAVDMAVAARRAANAAVLRGENPSDETADVVRWVMRQSLEAAASSIVAAWQRAEEAAEGWHESDHLPNGEPEHRTATVDRTGSLRLNPGFGRG